MTPTKKPVTKIKKKDASAQERESEVVKVVNVQKKHDFLYAVGKRKTAAARVRLYPKDGRGEIVVNEKDYKTRFPYFEFQQIIEQPLKKVNLLGRHYITVRVVGGGIRAQAEAIRHGLARILLKLDESFRKTMRSEGWLTRDPREKERKKPGLKRARRAPQWQKR